jgi:hypothetical protein
MRERLGIAVIAGGVAVVLTLTLVGLLRPPAAKPGGTTAATGTATAETPESLLKGNLSLEGSRLTQKDEQGNQEWALQAGTQLKVDTEKKIATGTQAHWYLEQGPKGDWEVEAPVVLFHYETGLLEFSSGVKVYSTDRQQRFAVKRLVYEPKSKELRGEGPVELMAGPARVTSERMVIQTGNRTVRLSGAVHMHVSK